MKNQLTFFGHASFKLVTKDDVVIYIDPAFPKADYSQAADIILITHHHGDHDKVELLTMKPECVILDNKTMLVDQIYQSKTIANVKIEAVEAYNKNHKKDSSVGYVLTLDDVVLYIAGDTSKTQQMTDLVNYNIDYAILPIDGFYNMGPKEADECIAMIKPKYFIPVHNDPRSMVTGKEYKTHFAALQSKNIIRINHGQTIDLKG